MHEVNPYESPSSIDLDSNDERYRPQIIALSGRIGRLRYVGYAMAYYLLFVTTAGVLVGLATSLRAQDMSDLFSGGVLIVGVLIYLFGFIVYLFLVRRRLNDLNRSGWFALFFLVPLINVFLGFYLLLWPGTNGRNNYGPAPMKNSSGVIIGATFGMIAFVGVIGAVAIPAYQAYIERALVVQTDD